MPYLRGQPVFLIGYRGTGKSTVGRELARLMGYEFVDADVLAEERAEKSIAAIFAEDGEATFRAMEAEIVAELGSRRKTVVALGGGAVVSPKNRATIRAAGPVVWLEASVDTIVKRLAADESTASRRPDLTAAGGRAEIESLLEIRAPLYRECATFVVNTDGKTAVELAGEILTML